MKILKSTILLIVVLFLGFVLWMNLTPGHFQKSVCGGAVYATDEELRREASVSFCTKIRELGNFEKTIVSFSLLDFNK